jgi:hypothetical protein
MRINKILSVLLFLLLLSLFEPVAVIWWAFPYPEITCGVIMGLSSWRLWLKKS